MDPMNDEVRRAETREAPRSPSASDAAAKAQELQRQAEAAQAWLLEATRRIEELKKANDDLIRAAKAQADQTIAAAESAAGEIIHSAQKTAADLLQQARARSEREVQAADDACAARLAQLRVDSDRLVGETNDRIAEIKRAAEQHVGEFAARVQTFLAEGERLCRLVEMLIAGHADALGEVTRLQGEVQEEILPALNGLKRQMGEVAEVDLRVAPLTPGELAGADHGSPVEPVWLAPAPSTGESTPAALHRGEILVGPVHSFRQASRVAAALAQITGVKSVKVRTYSSAKAVLDVVTEGQTLKDIDVARIEGMSIDVVEATETRLSLQIDPEGSRSVAR